jgi:hypothetical protein
LTELYDAWKVFGGVGVLALLYAWGYIATGRELKRVEQQLEYERKEKEFWREIAWSTSRTLDSVSGSLPPKGTGK